MTDTNNNLRVVTGQFRAMGTTGSVEIVLGENQTVAAAEQAVQAVGNIFHAQEKIFSRFDSASELSRLNQSLGEEKAISDEMLAVLQICLNYCGESCGYFDPRIISQLEQIGYDKDFLSNDLNSEQEIIVANAANGARLSEDIILDASKQTVILKKRVDLAGAVKGYALDRAAQALHAQGFANFLLEAGGDMSAAGKNSAGEAWRIDVEGVSAGKIMLELTEAGIATSGISRRRWNRGGQKVHHLVNPKQPDQFASDLRTVTVIAESATIADCEAKTLFLMGLERGQERARQKGIKALFLTYRGVVYVSETMKSHLVS